VDNLRTQIRKEALAHQEREAQSRPVVAALGWLDYDQLKAEVQSSMGEVVPGYAPHSDELNAVNPVGLIHALNCAGVECFYWSGMIILRIRNSALCARFFL
jgi:hypothetical protein